MIQSCGCSWCHAINRVGADGWPVCRGCGHRADVARMLCDCALCRERAAAASPVEVAHPSPLDLADYVARHLPDDPSDPAVLFGGYVVELEAVARLAAEFLRSGGGVMVELAAALDRADAAALRCVEAVGRRPSGSHR